MRNDRNREVTIQVPDWTSTCLLVQLDSILVFAQLDSNPRMVCVHAIRIRTILQSIRLRITRMIPIAISFVLLASVLPPLPEEIGPPVRAAQLGNR